MKKMYDIGIVEESKPEKLSRLKQWIKRMYEKHFPQPIHILQHGDRFWVMCEYLNGKVVAIDTDIVITHIAQIQIDKKIKELKKER